MDFSKNSAGNVRTRDILARRAVYEGTQYETFKLPDGTELDSYDWTDDVDASGNRIPALWRKPKVQMGYGETLVNTIVDLVVGEGRFPSFNFKESSPASARVTDALGPNGINLEYNATEQAIDLAVCGAAVFGFSYIAEADRFEYVCMMPEWAEPVFMRDIKMPRSRELFSEAAKAGAPVLIRNTWPGDELVFLRYEWPVTKVDGNVIWRRVDYTPDAIIRYADLEAADSYGAITGIVREFRPLPVKPHNWGFVPVVWMKGRNSAPNETEGKPLLTEAVASQIRNIDYTMSFWSDILWYSGAPAMLERDLMDDFAASEQYHENGTVQSNVVGVGPRAYLKRRSLMMDQPGDMKLIETNGQSFIAFEHAIENYIKQLYETSRISRHDPEKAIEAASGIALQRLMRPMIAQVNAMKAVMQRGWLELVRKLLAVFDAVDTFTIKWPPIFDIDAADVSSWAGGLTTAVNGGIISPETATRKLLSVLNEEDDVDEELARIAGGLVAAPEITTTEREV